MRQQPQLFKNMAGRFQRIRAHPATKRAVAAGQWILLALIVAYLLWRLTHIGWSAVLENLPASPWFYIFLALKFLSLPVAETFVYQIIWERPLLSHFPAFIRKRVYNNAVAGYSGEAFLALWARRRLGLSDLDAIVAVKDSNILSAFTANIMTVALIVWLAASGGLGRAVDAVPAGPALFTIAFFMALSVAVGVLALRRRLVSLPWGKSRAILGVHAVRQIAQIAIYSALYAAALPATPIGVWFSFVALQYVITRIPFLPNQELVYLTAALSLGSIVGAPEEAVAGMLLAEAGLLQGLYFLLFFTTAHLARSASNKSMTSPLPPLSDEP
ncbi:MAG: hypothetical protein VX640_01460 [Pseudomonadota bacterium]|nr:hypothetical protein [Pseudomonadota bacterium]